MYFFNLIVHTLASLNSRHQHKIFYSHISKPISPLTQINSNYLCNQLFSNHLFSPIYVQVPPSLSSPPLLISCVGGPPFNSLSISWMCTSNRLGLESIVFPVCKTQPSTTSFAIRFSLYLRSSSSPTLISLLSDIGVIDNLLVWGGYWRGPLFCDSSRWDAGGSL